MIVALVADVIKTTISSVGATISATPRTDDEIALYADAVADIDQHPGLLWDWKHPPFIFDWEDEGLLREQFRQDEVQVGPAAVR